MVPPMLLITIAMNYLIAGFVAWRCLGGSRLRKCSCGKTLAVRIPAGEIAVAMAIGFILSLVVVPILALLL